MDPDRQIVFFGHDREDRLEFGLIQRAALDVGVELDAFCAQILDAAVNFLDHRIHVVHRQRRREAGEALGIFGA